MRPDEAGTTGPLRSAWNRPVVAPQKWLNWLPALISIHSGLTLMSFVTQYAHPMVNLLADSVSPRDEIQALGGTVTIDTPIATMSGTTLFDGIFQAKGPGSINPAPDTPFERIRSTPATRSP